MEERPIQTQQRQLKKWEIHIEGILSGDRLKMSDNGRTVVNSEDTVEWIIDGGSGVESITQIYPKVNSDDVFETGPSEEPQTKKWKGKIKKVNIITTEEYNIEYKKTGDSNTYTYDPTIQANP